ncbi:MAG TPA: YihY/virulence factor BrkB family protein [Phnomibacter sp.]|nr:YihY/virulence factor BrkB family protein [Phnomibacter sp.]
MKKACINWYDRDPFREGAVIAYYAIFALPGLLVLIISVSGYFFGNEIVSGHMERQVAAALGRNAASQVQSILTMSMESKGSVWATIIGALTLLVGATGVFVQLQRILNNIWGVEVKPSKSGIWDFFKTRIFSFGLIISIAFLLLMFLVLSSLVNAFTAWIHQYLSSSVMVIFQVFDFLLSLAVITVLFALMLRILPDARIKQRSVVLGAFITALLFVLGKSALGIYFGKAEPGSGYGPAGSIILILLWTSYSSMIVFLGAEFTKVYSDHYFGRTAPSEIAVKVDT